MNENFRMKMPLNTCSRCAALYMLLAAHAGYLLAAEGGKGPPSCPPIQRLVWHAPQRIRWRLENTPLWFSVGHTSRILCFIPLGVKEEGGKVVKTEDGSGSIIGVRVELRMVDAFVENSSVPLKTRLIQSRTIRAGDPAEMGERRKWPFPTEQGVDFELSELEPRRQQSLFRIFDQPSDAQFWCTLMVHAEADLEDLPVALATPSGTDKCFTAFTSYTIVCELLNDPTLKLTSTYIEPDDPPSTWWIGNESVKAPWSYNRKKLQPVKGSLAFSADGQMHVGVLSATAVAAEQRLTEASKPKFPTLELLDIDHLGGPDVDLELDEK